jgi:CRISP-associated protein Cas1
MTLKGKTNHYNIKFLKGYGFSIKVKDSKIILKNNYNVKLCELSFGVFNAV